MEIEETPVEEKLIDFNWKALIIGLILSLVLGIALKYIIPQFAGIISMIIACGIAGYIAKGHVLNGALHGGLIGLIEAIISIAIIFYMSQFNTTILSMLSSSFIGDLCLGIIGGCIGNIIALLIPK
jgi:hypothetical protein